MLPEFPTESGDLHDRGPNGVAAANYPVGPGARTAGAEVRIFAPDGTPLLSAEATIVLEDEVLKDGIWTKEAEDTLR